MDKQKIVIQRIYDDICNIWDKTGSFSGVVIYIFVAIDACSFLSMPSERQKNTKEDFIKWVDKYLKTENTQPYLYVGKDFYGARCAKLHAFSSESAYSEKNNCKIFGYWDGKNHCFDPSKTENKNFVVISVPRLIDDFGLAITKFSQDILNDSDLKRRVESKHDKVYQLFNID